VLAAAGLPTLVPAEGLALAGSEIVIHVPGAPERRGTQVIGAQLHLPGYGALTIDSAELDRESRFGNVWLYQLNTEDGSLCSADAGGDTRAVLVPGYFDAKLDYHPDPTRFSLSCLSGVQAKCLRWGYTPWHVAPLTGESLAPYYQACIRMARADYCGDDQPTTRDGTLIDLYDEVGVQQPGPEDPGSSSEALAFEAGWGTAGAVCVAHPRIAANLDLADLPTRCPRLSDTDLGKICTEAEARRRGALLFNRSNAQKKPAG